MKNKVFLILLAAVLAISLSVVSCAGGEEEEEEEEEPEVIELIFSYASDPDNPFGQALTAYANYIADHSNGKVEIEKIGYNGEILSQEQVFEGVQAGTVDCASYDPDIVDGLEYFQVMQMPFMGWPSQQAATDVFWDLVEDYDEILGQFPSTLTFATLYMGAPYQLHYYAEDFVADTPDDIAGLEIICMEDYTYQVLSMLGATPVLLGIPDLIPSFETQLGDGFAQLSEFLWAAVGIEFFHSHTLFQGGIVMLPVGMLWNTKSYNAIVEAVGEEVMDGARAIYCETFDLWRTVDTVGALEWWVTHDDTVTYLNSTQTEVWADACADYITEWENACDDPELAADIYDAAKAYIAALQT